MVSCRLSATGVRFSGHPIPARGVGPSSRPAYQPPHRRWTPSGLPRSAPTSNDRGGRLLYPGDGGALLTGCRARPVPAASQRHVPTPRYHIPPAELRFTRHQRRFTRFTHPVCPSPVTSQVEQEILRPSPRASHPAVTSSARQGRGQAMSTSPELHHQHHLGRPISELSRSVRPRVATADPGVARLSRCVRPARR